MEIKTDIQIAQEADLKPIREISDSIGIEEKYLELYGNYKAKIDYNMLSKVKDREDGNYLWQIFLKIVKIFLNLTNLSFLLCWKIILTLMKLFRFLFTIITMQPPAEIANIL